MDASESAEAWVAMVSMSVFGALGHWLLILAHRRAPASVVAPFFYAQLIWAVILGTLVFHELPDGWTLLGGIARRAPMSACEARGKLSGEG